MECKVAGFMVLKVRAYINRDTLIRWQDEGIVNSQGDEVKDNEKVEKVEKRRIKT